MELQTLAPRPAVVVHPRPQDWFYRPVRASDSEQLKAAHNQLFPINYEDEFFRKAVYGLDRLFSWVAVSLPPGGAQPAQYGAQLGQGSRDSSADAPEQLVGFVTARLMHMHECDPVDRRYMGVGSPAYDGEDSVYILTLGVLDSHRGRGVASGLLGLVVQHARRRRCCAVFLHVINYNKEAIRLYQRNEFQCVAFLAKFYHIDTGRQPNPEQTLYDAYLYCVYPMRLHVHGGPPPGPSCCSSTALLVSRPIRHAWHRISQCLPGGTCQPQFQPEYHHALGAYMRQQQLQQQQQRGSGYGGDSSNNNGNATGRHGYPAAMPQPPPGASHCSVTVPPGHDVRQPLMAGHHPQHPQQQRYSHQGGPLGWAGSSAGVAQDYCGGLCGAQQAMMGGVPSKMPRDARHPSVLQWLFDSNPRNNKQY